MMSTTEGFENHLRCPCAFTSCFAIDINSRSARLVIVEFALNGPSLFCLSQTMPRHPPRCVVPEAHFARSEKGVDDALARAMDISQAARVNAKAKAVSSKDARDRVITDEHLENARFGMLPDKLLIGCLVRASADIQPPYPHSRRRRPARHKHAAT